MKDKKGVAILWLIPMMIILFIIVFLGLIVLNFTSRVNSEFQKIESTADLTTAKDVGDRVQEISVKSTDSFVLFFFLGMNIILIFAAVKTNFNPTIIFIWILLLLISIPIAAGLVNLYQGAASINEFSDIAKGQTFTRIIFSRFFPTMMTILGGVVIAVMYGKSGGDIVR